MATANERQVGGYHYGGGEYQHWDWVCDINLHYLPATASKYVFRHRKKKPKEDLEKALHYIQKAEEERITGNPCPQRMSAFWRLALEQEMKMVDALICWYLQEGEWEAARLAIQEVLNQTF